MCKTVELIKKIKIIFIDKTDVWVDQNRIVMLKIQNEV